jgi:hypothetical protein
MKKLLIIGLLLLLPRICLAVDGGGVWGKSKFTSLYVGNIYASTVIPAGSFIIDGPEGIGTYAPISLLDIGCAGIVTGANNSSQFAVGQSVDGNALLASFINTIVSSSGSTNETSAIDLSWREGGTSVAKGTRILAGKEADYNSAGNAKSFLSFYTTSANTMAEKARITSLGHLLIGTTDDDGTPATGKLIVKGTTNNGTTNLIVGRDSDEVNVFTVDTDGTVTAPSFVGALTGNASGSSGSCTGNAGTVTNGVYTTSNQSIAGIKTFSDATEASNATTGGTVVSGGLAVAKRVYATDMTVTNAISGSITGNAGGSSASCTGNAATVTNGVYTTNNLSVMSATTSAQLSGILSDEQGSGAAVFATSPTITTPTITAGSDVTPLKIKRGTDTNPAANLIEVYKNDGATLLSAMAYDGRWRLAIPSTSPTVAPGAGAGAGATTTLTGTDSSGELTITTATVPAAASTICTVTFNRAFTNAPAIIFSPSSATSALLSGVTMIYTTSTTTTFLLTSGSTGLTTGTIYKFFYQCLGQ